MALMPRLRQMLRRPTPVSSVGARRPTSAERWGDSVHEDALRAQLQSDPNNVAAFGALAEIVRRHAAASHHSEDPLAAPADEHEKARAAELAVWSLAEELAGNPRGWYPLIELGRLSLDDDAEGALRRLATAAEREPTGTALVEALVVLRDAGRPVDALGLGVGHWRARDHTPEVGRQIVLAALEADRPFDAKHHLGSLDLYPDQEKVAPIRAELEAAVAAAGASSAGG